MSPRAGWTGRSLRLSVRSRPGRALFMLAILAGFPLFIAGSGHCASPDLGSSSAPSASATVPTGSEADDTATGGDQQQPSSSTLRWSPNTSGPFFTGTAETEPLGSSYFEPITYAYLSSGGATVSNLLKVAVGLGHHLEFDMAAPLVYATDRTSGASSTGLGDTNFQGKWQLIPDADTNAFLAFPATSLTFGITVPTGSYENLDPAKHGVDQFGNGTVNESIGLLIRKRARPFLFYAQLNEIIQNQARVEEGYTFNDGLTRVPPGESFRMVDGNLIYYTAVFEHVVNERWQAGYLLELFGEWQSAQSLFFGSANAPAWSFLWAAAEAEVTWPRKERFSATWGIGAALPVYTDNYRRNYTLMGTVTLYYNGLGGSRDE
ncbi:MAG TPA: hypothetical protein VLY45_04200 [Nitrospiria bacterium]|nr:hypothetical protein [Nitrospiria bacterium]